MLQFVAVEPREDRAFHRLNRGDDAVDALAAPPKRHAFAAAARLDVGDFGDDDFDRGLDPARGRQRARERPRAARDGQSLRMWRHVRPDPFGKSLRT
jgi:hypothetical protein